MALDATPGGANAESYLTVADADTLAASLGFNGWASKTTTIKEQALRRASSELDVHRFHDPEPWSSGQRRAFPRSKDSGTIPEPVKWAALMQADYLATAGESDKKMWDGPKAAPVKDAGVGSPLCPRAFNQLARYISRVGGYAG